MNNNFQIKSARHFTSLVRDSFYYICSYFESLFNLVLCYAILSIILAYISINKVILEIFRAGVFGGVGSSINASACLNSFVVCKRFFFYSLLVVLTAPAVSLGQHTSVPESETTGINAEARADIENIEVRQPPADKLSEYRNDGDFVYEDEATPKEAESLLDKIRNWISVKIGELLNQPGTQNILKIVFYALFAALILLLLNEFMKGNIKNLFLKKNALKPRTLSMMETDGNEDLDHLIREAVENNQFGIAVRYLYQRSLVQLQDAGYINWEKNKTNRDYLYEIPESELRNLFREVTRYYEYAEYGNFSISNTDFKKVRYRFNQLETIMQNKS